MPTVSRVLQAQHRRDVLALLGRRLAVEAKQQELASAGGDADKQVLADFKLLGAPEVGGPLLGMAQGVAQPNGDGGRNGYRSSPAMSPLSSMSANCSATSRGESRPPGRYQV